MLSLSQSYHYCNELTQRTAHNFRFSFLTLPRDKRQAMNALYAFNRITDDIGDDERVPLELRRARLAAWRETFRIALNQGPDRDVALLPESPELDELFDHPAKAAILDVVNRHQIPSQYLFDVIDGVEMDLHPSEFATFLDLERYCYRVAGAVGLCCIHIWGFHDQAAIPLAIDCGTALQLTNILRDLGEDAVLGRVYLPREELVRYGFSADNLRDHVFDERFHRLMRFQADRAKSYYQRAEQLFEFLEPCGRPILRAMLDIYGGLLREIERRNFEVFSKRVSLPKWKKLWFASRAMLSSRSR